MKDRRTQCSFLCNAMRGMSVSPKKAASSGIMRFGARIYDIKNQRYGDFDPERETLISRTAVGPARYKSFRIVERDLAPNWTRFGWKVEA